MSVGNLKDSGNQGNNFPWQLKMLLGQQCACDQLTAINANTDQVEGLLTAILTTLQAETEYEAKFVVDTCNGDTVYLEVRVWNPDTSDWGPITYYLPGSATPVVPPGASTPGCLQYTDPSAVLALILGAIQAGNVILQDIDNNTDGLETILTNLFNLYSAGQQVCADSLSVTLCTEQGNTLSGILTELQSTLDVNITNATLAVTQSGAWTVTSNQGTSPWVVSGTVALDAATLAALEIITVNQGTSPWVVSGTIAATQSGTWNINNISGTISLPTGAATEATLGVLNSQFIPATRTPSLIRTGGSGTIAAGARSISVYNAGSVAGSILGVAGNILPGEIFNFDAGGENDTLAAFAYNGAGTTLVITTIV